MHDVKTAHLLLKREICNQTWLVKMLLCDRLFVLSPSVVMSFKGLKKLLRSNSAKKVLFPGSFLFIEMDLATS